MMHRENMPKWKQFWTDAIGILNFWFAKIKELWMMKVSFCGYIYADFSSDLGKCSSVLNHMCFYSSKLVRFTKSP